MADLNPIRALLHALDEKAEISVVAATTSLDEGVDLEKIARYVEEIPDLQMAVVLEILNIFRKGCRNEQLFIEPEKLDANENWGEIKSKIAHFFNATKIASSEDALVYLGSSGRVLKQGLRLCYEKWQLFRGEIYFEDLLIFCLLKVSKPHVFSVITKNDSIFRNNDSAAEERLTQIYDEEKFSSLDKQLAKQIRRDVFLPVQGRNKFQSLAHEEYWRRFLREEEIPSSQRDQNILRAIADNDTKMLMSYILNESNDELLEDVSQSNKVVHFEQLLMANTAVKIFENLISTLLDKKWIKDIGPGLTPMTKILVNKRRRNEINESDFFEMILNALKLAIPNNLVLTADLYRLFQDENALILDSKFYNKFKIAVCELISQSYLDKPAKLIAAIKGARSAELLWLCRGLDRIRAQDLSMSHFPKWFEFSQTLLEATRQDPRTMLPQLAWFVVESDKNSLFSRTEFPQYKYRADLAEKFFGGSSQVLDVLKGLSVTEWSEPQVIAFFGGLT